MLIRFDWSLGTALGLTFLLSLTLILSRRRYRSLAQIPRSTKSSSSAAADCMVVIPARNEQGNIGRAVSSLPHDTVIVVDDSSTDKTAEEARKAGAGVLPAPKPGDAALGKASACMAGARILTSRWILFADADTRYQPGFLEAAVTAAESEKLDFLSLYLRPEYRTFSESVLSPFAGMLYFCGIDPRTDPAGAFNGQCVLVRRDPYEFVGGHRALLTALCEDVQMAELAQRHRMKFAVARAPEWGWVRIRPRDFERNAFRFAVNRIGKGMRIVAVAMAWALWLPMLVVLLARQQWITAGLFIFVPSLLLGSWYGWARAILAPLGILGMQPIVIRGAVSALMHRHVYWKGRVI